MKLWLLVRQQTTREIFDAFIALRLSKRILCCHCHAIFDWEDNNGIDPSRRCVKSQWTERLIFVSIYAMLTLWMIRFTVNSSSIRIGRSLLGDLHLSCKGGRIGGSVFRYSWIRPQVLVLLCARDMFSINFRLRDVDNHGLDILKKSVLRMMSLLLLDFSLCVWTRRCFFRFCYYR